MSAIYAKQVEWKKSSASRAKDNVGGDETDLTFQPVFYTSKDTAHKFKVAEKVGALTAAAGSAHVDRLKKAAAIKDEANRKLYGVSSNVGKKKPAFGANVVQGAGSYSAALSAAQGVGSSDGAIQEAVSGTLGYADVLAASASTVSSSSAAHSSSLAAQTHKDGGTNVRTRNTPESLAAMDEYALVEVLERERREWHQERVKLLQCIHLQQLELAARASAAQVSRKILSHYYYHFNVSCCVV